MWNNLTNVTYIKAKIGYSKIPVFTPKENLELKFIIKNNLDIIDKILLTHGGLLLRGFNINSVSEFNVIANIVSPNLLEYINRSTPITKLGGKIYTATEYPADRFIPFHNENSYTLQWPRKIIFYCIIVAASGGETPIADSRNVYQLIDPSIIEKFNKKKILYVRNYIPGIDLNWQEAFQTSNKSDVEKYCNLNSIAYRWQPNQMVELITKQICQATITHPISKEKVWFNQAHLFHPSSLDNLTKQQLIKELGEENLTRQAYYGDGSNIEESYLINISNAYEQEKVEFKWQKNDLLILDNILMAHSRNSYIGPRKIAVSMGT